MGKLGPMVKVKYLRNTCAHKKGDVSMMYLLVARAQRRRGIIKFVKVLDK